MRSRRRENGGARSVRAQVLGAIAAVAFVALFLLPIYSAFASVSLSSFTAEPGVNEITLRWETGSEIDTLGFNIWRGTECDAASATKVNSNLIPAQGSGATGAQYEYVDTDVQPNVLYDYRLEDIENNGQSVCHQDFPLQASTLGGGSLPTPPGNGGGGGGGAATSTSAPTATPGPTSTPRPNVTASPNSQQPTATSAASNSNPTPTTAQPQATSAVQPPQTTGAGNQTEGQQRGYPAPSEDGSVDNVQAQAATQQTADTAVVTENEGTTGTNPTGISELPQNVGEPGDAEFAQTVGEGVNILAEDAAVESAGEQANAAPSSGLTVAILLGGSLFTLGGIIAIWYFVIKRQGG